VQLHWLLEKLPAAAYACDAGGVITYFNERAVQLWGRTPTPNEPADQFCGSFKLYSTSGEPLPREQSPMALALRTGREQHCELEVETPDRRRLTLLNRVNPMHDGSGTLLGAIGVLIDITERKRTEKAAARERDFAQFVLDHIPGIVCLFDEKRRLKRWNRRFVEVSGYSPDELVHKSGPDFVDPGDQQAVAEHAAAAFSHGESSLEANLLARDGTRTPYLLTGARVQFDGASHLVGMGIDISNWKRAEERLRESEAALRENQERLRLAVEAANLGTWDWDIRKDTTHFSPEWKRLIGYEDQELPNAHEQWLSRLHPEDRDQVLAALQDYLDGRRAEYAVQYRLRHRDGSYRWIYARGLALRDADGRPTRMLGCHVDITERTRAEEQRRKMEAQMLHAQKLESLGVLAGGIAHDFNNLLTSMLGNANLALIELPDDSLACPMLQDIEEAAQRAADLTHQMLAYSGKGAFVIQPLRLDILVQEMAKLLRTVVSKKATLELKLEPATIEGDATQIRQVVMNLITNASDALEGAVGTIRVRTGTRDTEAAELRSPFLPAELPSGTYAYVEVEDTGCGMNEETLGRIFDPFFTTKFTGRGLGLAAALGIVRGHRGMLRVASTPGLGTVFKVLMPAATMKLLPEDSIREAPLPRGHGTVLVVEDESAVRTFARRALESGGFYVRTAENGLAGLDAFRKHLQKIDAVLLDLTMPGMDGLEVLTELRRLAPNVPILVMSGYGERDVSGALAEAGATGFVAKPFLPRELLARVSHALSASGREAGIRDDVSEPLVP
jgi:PAS domain S-box-containing protein